MTGFYSPADLDRIACRLRGLAADKTVAAKAVVALAKYDADPAVPLGPAADCLTDANVMSCAADILGDLAAAPGVLRALAGTERAT